MDLIKDLFKGDKVIWIIFLFLCLISIIPRHLECRQHTYLQSGDHWAYHPAQCHPDGRCVCIVVLVHNIPCKYFRTSFFLLPISAVLLIL